MAAAVQWEDDLLGLTSKDERDLREYFQDSEASVGGLKAYDIKRKLDSGTAKGNGVSPDVVPITDRQMARAANAQRVECIRDGLRVDRRNGGQRIYVKACAAIPDEAWHTLSDAYSQEQRHYRGVSVELSNLLADTPEAMAWGMDIARVKEAEGAITRALTSARSDGFSPMSVTQRGVRAMELAEATEIGLSRANEEAVAELLRMSGMSIDRRGRRNAERYEAVLSEARGQLARAADAWVRARLALGVKHNEDTVPRDISGRRDALRECATRVRRARLRSESV